MEGGEWLREGEKEAQSQFGGGLSGSEGRKGETSGLGAAEVRLKGNALEKVGATPGPPHQLGNVGGTAKGLGEKGRESDRGGTSVLRFSGELNPVEKEKIWKHNSKEKGKDGF